MITKTIFGISKAFKNAINKTIDDVFFPYKLVRPEALKILDLPPDFSQKELDTKFKNFYVANSVENKGSPYIQEKIKGAYKLLKKASKSQC
ncbi:hypothetical protein GINT2_000266 [Glugoides intestinalis]